MKKILSNLRRAVNDYNLIEDGDKILVGVSGGKDSMTLVYALKLFQRFSPVKFELEAITVTLGFKDFDITPIKDFLNKIEVPYHVIETRIGELIFEVRKEKNPCSLCANMRRGAIHNFIKDKGFNVIALGHHKDDVVETLFMNMFYNGKVNTFLPKTYLEKSNVNVIRPFIYINEIEVIGANRRNNIPIVESPCPANKNTKREEIKNLMKSIYKDIPTARKNILTAIKNEDQFQLWFK